ncbi:hypothetical protein COT58_03945 [Candidatus Micrarchaeota archaeon CG09_land_8_20_14_0_10_60_16]|nr:MAG: hypothetical protein COT58_03945 [Candidatus Micrarchaeota archaeon CG09_land_8_20_14_0_10_60_16]
MGFFEGLRESAAGFYSVLEEKWYSFVDWLGEKGAPIGDWFVSPLEERGVPSFPVAALIALLLLGGLAFVLLQPAGVSLQVTVVSGVDGSPVAGAKVSLSAGDKSLQALTDASGIAKFDGLPAGSEAVVKISKDGFNSSTSTLPLIPVAGSSVVASSVLLSPVSAEKPKITVFVSNADGAPIGNASIAFVDQATGRVRELQTDSAGAAYIEFSDESELFNVRVTRDGFTPERATCFASKGECSIQLSSDADTPVDQGGSKELESSVLVLVKNGKGDAAKARVTLMDADSGGTLSADYSASDGSVRFNGVTAGVRVYVLVEPDDSAYRSYNGGLEQDYQTVSATHDTEFRVQLEKKSQGDTEQVRFAVKTRGGDPIQSASVKLYSTDGQLVLLGSQDTDAAGEAVFEMLSTVSAYAAVWADGFLPLVEKSVKPGDSKAIALDALVPGNNGKAGITVFDADGGRAEYARVTLSTADGFALGMPDQETAEDGITEFSGLPLEELRASAAKGSSHGTGDSFTVSYSSDASATVNLEPTYGFIQVKAVDASHKEEKTVQARVTAFVSDKQAANCTTPAGNASQSYCTLKVRANKPFVLKATASGYASYASEAITVSTGQTSKRTLELVPTAMADQLGVVSVKLYDAETGAEVPEKTEVERGSYYDVVITVNLPSGADKSGFYLRVGNAETVAKDAVAINYYDEPKEAVITAGAAYRQNASCSSFDQAGSEAKWVNVEYDESVFGVKAFKARVFVRPTATQRDALSVYYRAYAVKNGLWYRYPVDSYLNYSQSKGSRGDCQAETKGVEYPVTEGRTTCNNDACLSISFESEGAVYSNGFTVALGKTFKLRATAKIFKSSAYPFLKVSSPDGQVLFQETLWHNNTKEIGASEFTQPLELGATGIDSLLSQALAGMPSNYAKLVFQLSDQNGAILSTDRFAVITGTGELALGVKPLTIESNKRSDLTATVLSSVGAPVTDARVEIEETVGSPFDGLQNGDYYVIGDGSRDNGEDGKYKFKSLNPVSPGRFKVVASKRDFKAAEQEVVVQASDFLSFSPDPASIKLTCNGATLMVENELAIEVPVTASFSGTPCVSLSGPRVTNLGDHKYSFTVPALQSTPILLNPLTNDQCYLNFNSVLKESGSAYSKNAWIQVECSELNGTVNATPSPGAQCSSANCAACTEIQCLDLKSKGNYCYPDYVILPSGNQSFKTCVTNQTTANNATTNATCNAQSCSGCKEADCLALQQQLKCIANYTYYSNGQKAFAFCSVYAAPDCSPGNFDLSNMLARRLGQYHANLLFNPTVNRRRIASSASNQVFVSNYGFARGKVGAGCEWSGNTLTCTKPVNAMFPVNGMTFSVQTTVMQDIQILKSADRGANGCFKITEVTGSQKFEFGSLIDRIIGTAQAITSSAFMAGDSPYKTYLILFDGTNKQCAHYYWNKGLHMRPTTGKDELEIRLSTASGSAYGSSNVVKIILKIEEQNGDVAANYALFAVPASGKVYSRQSGKILEPVFITANMYDTKFEIVKKGPIDVLAVSGNANFQSGKADLGKGGLAFIQADLAKSAQSFDIYVNNVKGTDFKFKSSTNRGTTPGDVIGMLDASVLVASAPVAPAQPQQSKEESLPEPGEGILYGPHFENYDSKEYNAEGGASAALACSGTAWCTPAQAMKAAAAAKQELNNFFTAFYQSLDKVDDTGAVQGTEEVFNKALGDSVADYGAKQATYELCKALGSDPLKGLQADCSNSMLGPGAAQQQPQAAAGTAIAPVPNSWQPPQGFQNVYGDAFSQTACNSELINYGFGSSQAFGPNFWTAFKTGLQGQLTPQTGEVFVGKPVISLNNLVVVIPMKIAGVGIVPYVFRFDESKAMAGGTAPGQGGSPDASFVEIGRINTFMNGAKMSQRANPISQFMNSVLQPFLYPYTRFVESTRTWYSTAGAMPIPYVTESKSIKFTDAINLYTLNKYQLDIAAGCFDGSELKYWPAAVASAPQGQEGGEAMPPEGPGGSVVIGPGDEPVFEGTESFPAMPKIAVSCSANNDAKTIKVAAAGTDYAVTVGNDASAKALLACLLDESKQLNGAVTEKGDTELTCTSETCACGAVTTVASIDSVRLLYLECMPNYASLTSYCDDASCSKCTPVPQGKGCQCFASTASTPNGLVTQYFLLPTNLEAGKTCLSVDGGKTICGEGLTCKANPPGPNTCQSISP